MDAIGLYGDDNQIIDDKNVSERKTSASNSALSTVSHRATKSHYFVWSIAAIDRCVNSETVRVALDASALTKHDGEFPGKQRAEARTARKAIRVTVTINNENE